MATFDFNQVKDIIPATSNSDKPKIEFLSLKDHGWMAEIRFMYGEGETFQAETVHNVAEAGKPARYVPCLREPGQPVDACPLCAKGSKIIIQYFIPVFVSKITSINQYGQFQEEVINRQMLLQRGSKFDALINSAIRQSESKPLVCTLFNLVRNGKAGETGTVYTLEKIKTDDTKLSDLIKLSGLSERINYKGTYVLPNITAEKMIEKYIVGAQTQPVASAVTPRTVNVNYAQPIPTQRAPF